MCDVLMPSNMRWVDIVQPQEMTERMKGGGRFRAPGEGLPAREVCSARAASYNNGVSVFTAATFVRFEMVQV